MQSLFDQEASREIISRINRLSPDSKPKWGKMTVSQMLVHAQTPLQVAMGEVKLKRGLLGILFGKIAKKQLLKTEPFKPNLPTAPELIVKDHPNFEDERNKLIGVINNFTRSGETGLTDEIHPFFGKMTPEEWDKLQWKHLDHHLRQFGV